MTLMTREATTRRWYVTGFEPFHEHKSNPSMACALACAETLRTLGEQATAHILPVTFDHAARWAEQTLHATHETPLIIHMGLAASRPFVSIERDAFNRCGTQPDNAGRSSLLPDELSLRPGAPWCMSTAFDVTTLCDALNAALHHDDDDHGAPLLRAQVTHDAGSYVCNAIYYASLSVTPHTLFVHLPELPNPLATRLGTHIAHALTKTT